MSEEEKLPVSETPIVEGKASEEISSKEEKIEKSAELSSESKEAVLKAGSEAPPPAKESSEIKQEPQKPSPEQAKDVSAVEPPKAPPEEDKPKEEPPVELAPEELERMRLQEEKKETEQKLASTTPKVEQPELPEQKAEAKETPSEEKPKPPEPQAPEKILKPQAQAPDKKGILFKINSLYDCCAAALKSLISFKKLSNKTEIVKKGKNTLIETALVRINSLIDHVTSASKLNKSLPSIINSIDVAERIIEQLDPAQQEVYKAQIFATKKTVNTLALEFLGAKEKEEARASEKTTEVK